MTFKLLKWLRVILSLVFIVFITFAFIDFSGTIANQWFNRILFFQFIPSVVKFLTAASIIASGFMFVLVLTLLFGRVYCSTLCPLGTFQDIINNISGKFKKRKHLNKFATPHNWLRYSILLLVILSVLTGHILLINLLDPYSIYGKISSSIFRPIYYLVNNIVVFFLERMEIFSLYHIDLKNIAWFTIGFSVVMFITIGILSALRGRLFCNTICPVGTFLGFISKYSIFRIQLNKTSCTSCGICGYACKADCIDTQNKEVDFSRCVSCFNCLTVCPGGGVTYKFNWTIAKESAIDIDLRERRTFLKNSVFIASGLSFVAKKSFSRGLHNGKIPVVREYPVIPPGALTIDHFVDKCTACQLCVSACPTQVLQPSFLQYGLKGMMQPFMDYNANYCNFECILCSEICPTSAIQPILLDDKKLTQLGKAKFIKENCVVYTDETACGACSEHCPTKAVNMVKYFSLKKDNLTIPEVNDKICIGCGACEYACPTDPKSIYVDGNPEHVFAEKPKEIKLDESKQTLEDFPF